jgi:threonine aldolase
MRQVGVLAAPGIVALSVMRHRLHEDHERAQALAAVLGKYERLEVAEDRVKINMVFCRVLGGNESTARFVEELKNHGILTYPARSGEELRFVLHYGITDEDIRHIEAVLPEIMDALPA